MVSMLSDLFSCMGSFPSQLALNLTFNLGCTACHPMNGDTRYFQEIEKNLGSEEVATWELQSKMMN